MRKISLGLLLLSLILSSCSKTIYLENMRSETGYEARNTELKIRKGDRLSIVVNSKTPEVAAPFNLQAGISYQVSGEGEITAGQNVNTSRTQGGYVVDDNGMIDFPVLGRVPVEKLTRTELSEEIKTRLIANKYIDDPIVNVDFSDVKVTVMGEVVRSGMIPMTGKGMNLLEALTMSGGLTDNAIAKKVSVIRVHEGKRMMYEADLCSTDLFNSPCFALQQDDIVYVQPKAARITTQEDRGLRYWGVATGLLSTIISLLILIK